MQNSLYFLDEGECFVGGADVVCIQVSLLTRRDGREKCVDQNLGGHSKHKANNKIF